MTETVAAYASFGLTVSEALIEIMLLETKYGHKMSCNVVAAGEMHKQTTDFVYLGGTIYQC